MYKTRKSIIIALLIAQALVLSILETMFPLNFVIPGIKIGLANIITILSLNFLGLRDTLIIVILRCLLVAIFAGNIIFFAFSITGGILSALIMFLLLRISSDFFSLIGISIIGAITHNFGQILIGAIIFMEPGLFYYLPVLILSGLIAGSIIGYISLKLCKFINGSRLLENI